MQITSDESSLQKNINRAAIFSILFFIISIPLSNVLMNIGFGLILFVYIFGGQYQEKYKQIKSTPALILFLLFFAWTIFSAIYSTAGPEFIKHDILKYQKILVLPAIVFYITTTRLNKYIYTFIASTILLILYTLIFDQHGLLLSLKSNSFIYSQNPLRSYIPEGILLAISLFATLWFIKKRIHTKLMSFLLIVVLIHITFNNGRMALLSALLSLLIFVFFSINNVKAKITLVIGVLLLSYGAYLTSPLIKARVDRTISEASQISDLSKTDSPRLMYWQLSTKKILSSNLIIGSGAGTFGQIVALSDVPDQHRIGAYHPHNEYLLQMLQYGLIGLSLFVSALYFSMRNFQVATTTPARVIAYAGILILLLNCITDSHLYASTEGNIFLVMLAIFLSKDKDSINS